PGLGGGRRTVRGDQVVVISRAVVAGPLGRGVEPYGTFTAPAGSHGALDGRGGSMPTNAIAAPAVRASKGSGTPLVMVTAYDAPGARMADEAGVDIILVGDSVAMVVLGYDDTLQVTVDDMAHHVAAVARAKPRPLIVGDMPWMSYHVSAEDTVRNAAVLMRAGAQSVK